MTEKIRVLIVDDSAFMRNAISSMVESDPSLEVADTARDGKDCMEKIGECKPDVVTLDIEMPRMDGLETLEAIMKTTPLPVLMLSTLTEEGAKATLDALDKGAVDFIPKNLDNLSFNIVNIKENLLKKIKSIARKRISSVVKTEKKVITSPSFSPRTGTIEMVAIGSSTGGPKALKDVLIQFPETMSASVLIVQHMPPVFVSQFASRLNQACAIEVKEAENGEKVTRGRVLIAPGGIHTTLEKKGLSDVRINLMKEPSQLYHKPSVDVMMLSVAEVYALRSLGVILTGMGNDGMNGMKAIKEKKGTTIAQDESSCVVYGMPKAVVDAGAADKVVPLSLVAQEIMTTI